MDNDQDVEQGQPQADGDIGEPEHDLGSGPVEKPEDGLRELPDPPDFPSVPENREAPDGEIGRDPESAPLDL